MEGLALKFNTTPIFYCSQDVLKVVGGQYPYIFWAYKINNACTYFLTLFINVRACLWLDKICIILVLLDFICNIFDRQG